MNKTQQKALGVTQAAIASLRVTLEALRDDDEFTATSLDAAKKMAEGIDTCYGQVNTALETEQEKFDDMSEAAQEGERGETAQVVIEALETACTNLEEAVSTLADMNSVEEAHSPLDDAITCLEAAEDSIDEALGA